MRFVWSSKFRSRILCSGAWFVEVLVGFTGTMPNIYNYNRRIHPKINSIQEWYQENLRIHVYFYLEFECNQLSQFILFLDSSFTNKSSVYVVYQEIVSMSNIKLSVNLPFYLLRCLLTGKFIIDSLNLLNFDALSPPSRNCALSCHCH